MQEKSKVEIVEIDIESEINAQWINALELRTLKNAFDLFSTEKKISQVEKNARKNNSFRRRRLYRKRDFPVERVCFKTTIRRTRKQQ